MALFLGIDGGGSKTSCVVGDEASVLGSGTAGGSNIVRVGEAQAGIAITAAIHEACAAAKVDPAKICCTCVGAAGAGRPEFREVLHRIVSELVGGEVEVVGDMVIALQSAFGSGPGVIVITGTGSIAYGRDSAGETARAGGWGYAVSDEGSGHWVGRSAIAACLRAIDQGLSHGPVLCEALMKAWKVSTVEQLASTANASPSLDFAALFPAVLTSANGGDPLAQEILMRAGHELAKLGQVVITRLFGERSVDLAMCGGVFASSTQVRDAFCDALRSKRPRAALIPKIVEPVYGALELARQGHRNS